MPVGHSGMIVALAFGHAVRSHSIAAWPTEQETALFRSIDVHHSWSHPGSASVALFFLLVIVSPTRASATCLMAAEK